MSDKIEAEILDVLGEEVDASVDTPLVVIEGPKGDPGEKGDKGDPGPKGDPGAAGQDGHSPVVTATKSGKTTTISVDGAAIATVEDGADGKPGAAGADGITPTIGDNGNWYLGAEDTGKPSRGETGPQGTPGKDGANGKDGKPGEKGADGAPGIYYGTTQPTGDTHPVWIDPDGDHDDGGLLPAVTAADNGKVLRVANGAWAPVDMPTGGGGEKWELIKAITIADDAAESNALTINMDESGNPFSLKKAKIFGIFPEYKGESTIPNFSFFMLNGFSDSINGAYCYTSGWETPSTNISKSCSTEVDLTAPGLQNETVWRSYSASKEYFGPAKIESVTSIGGTNMLIYPGCQFWLYGVRKEGTA